MINRYTPKERERVGRRRKPQEAFESSAKKCLTQRTKKMIEWMQGNDCTFCLFIVLLTELLYSCYGWRETTKNISYTRLAAYHICPISLFSANTHTQQLLIEFFFCLPYDWVRLPFVVEFYSKSIWIYVCKCYFIFAIYCLYACECEHIPCQQQRI